MRIYNREMLKARPASEHIIDDISDRNFGSCSVGCGAIAITNVLNFYGKSYLRAPTLQDMILEAHFSLEETQDGGLYGDRLLNFLNNEGLYHKVVSYPKEIDLLEAVADPLRLGLLIVHINGATHIQTLRKSASGRFLYGTLELTLDEVLNLTEERQEYKSVNQRIHYSPSVLIKITTKKRVE